MKKLGTVILASSLLPLTGCINLSFGGHRPPPAPSAPINVIPSAPFMPSDAATIAEIDAAARLNFDSAKKESLAQLARRPGLTPPVQVHLVNVTYRSFSADHAKVELLQVLIANPGFSDAARRA